MKLSVELSLYPLSAQYIPVILDFIERIRDYPGIDVQSNALSTQLFGDYAQVMAAVGAELRHSFETHGAAVLVAKFVPGDARELQ